MATWVCTVPDHCGGPQRSIDSVEPMPMESAPSAWTGSTRLTNTVSLRMVEARQATRSCRAATLVRQRLVSVRPASGLKRNAGCGRGWLWEEALPASALRTSRAGTARRIPASIRGTGKDEPALGPVELEVHHHAAVEQAQGARRPPALSPHQHH